MTIPTPRRTIPGGSLFLLALAGSVTAQQVVTFTDGEFTTWNHTFCNAGSAGGNFTYSAGGGNPGAQLILGAQVALAATYRHVMRNDAATWDPATQGAICSVSFSMDVALLTSSNGATSVHLLARQNGANYISPGFTPVLMPWTNYGLGPYRASDFSLVCAGAGPTLSFAAGAAPITFGFVTTTSNCGVCVVVYNTRHYDNWRVTIAGGAAATATATPVGQGCGGGPVPPVLSSALPRIGTTVTLTIANGAANRSGDLFASLGIGAPIALGGGCQIHLDLPTLVPVLPVATNAAGGFGIGIPVPLAPELLGLQIALQGILYNTAGPLGFDLTNAVLLTFGC